MIANDNSTYNYSNNDANTDNNDTNNDSNQYYIVIVSFAISIATVTVMCCYHYSYL